MNNFSYWNYTDMRFGRGVEEKAGELTAQFGKKCLLHYGGGSIKKSGLFDRVVHSLRAAGVEIVELGGVAPNPRLSKVYEGIGLCRKEGVDVILAVGGGSVIDSAKAIAWGVKYDGDVWDFFTGAASLDNKERVPLGAIPTLPAAGSECSYSMVISKEDTQEKLASNYPRTRPEFALLNPELTFTLPPFQTACGIADSLAHIMERYFTNTDHVDMTDRMCEAVMKTIIVNAPVVMANPTDYNARAELMWAASQAHCDILGVGRTQAWASHRLEHELSAFYDIAHGAGLSVIFPAWMKFFSRKEPAKLLQFAQRVFDVQLSADRTEDIIDEGIARLEAFFKSLDLPIRLSELGIDDSRFGEMSTRCVANSYGRRLTPEECTEIYKLAM